MRDSKNISGTILLTVDTEKMLENAIKQKEYINNLNANDFLIFQKTINQRLINLEQLYPEKYSSLKEKINQLSQILTTKHDELASLGLIDNIERVQTSADTLIEKPLEIAMKINKLSGAGLNLDAIKEVSEDLGIIGKAVDFLKFPVTCAMYVVRERLGIFEGLEPKPTAPWRDKDGLAKFGLSSLFLGLGIAAMVVTGAAIPIGIAAASVSLARGLWGLGTTIYDLRQLHKETDDINKQTMILAQKDRDPQEEAEMQKLEARSNEIDKKITGLNSKKNYIDIAEKAIGAGIAVLSLAGAVLALTNPVTAPIVATVALGAGIAFGIYKLAKFIKGKYSSSKNKEATSPEMKQEKSSVEFDDKDGDKYERNLEAQANKAPNSKVKEEQSVEKPRAKPRISAPEDSIGFIKEQFNQEHSRNVSDSPLTDKEITHAYEIKTTLEKMKPIEKEIKPTDNTDNKDDTTSEGPHH